MDALQWQKDKLKEAQQNIDYHTHELEHWRAEKVYYEKSLVAIIEAAEQSVQPDAFWTCARCSFAENQQSWNMCDSCHQRR